MIIHQASTLAQLLLRKSCNERTVIKLPMFTCISSHAVRIVSPVVCRPSQTQHRLVESAQFVLLTAECSVLPVVVVVVLLFYLHRDFRVSGSVCGL